MKTAVKHCVSSAYQIGTGGGVEGRRGLGPASYPMAARDCCRQKSPPAFSAAGLGVNAFRLIKEKRQRPL